MATVAQNLRSFLLDDNDISELVGERVHHNHVPQDEPRPFIFLQLTGTEDLSCLDDPPGTPPFRFRYAAECVADTIGDADELAALVKARCNLYTGSFGAGTAQRLFAEDQDEDYVPKANSDDALLHVSAVAVEVVP